MKRNLLTRVLSTVLLTTVLSQPSALSSSSRGHSSDSDCEDGPNSWSTNKKSQETKLDLSSQNINAQNLNNRLKQDSLAREANSLYLDENDLQTEGLRQINLSIVNKVTLLSFRECRIRQLPSEFIDQLENSKVETLILSDNFIDQSCLESLFPAINKTRISHLHLNNNDLGDQGISYLTKNLSKTSLKGLYLSNVKISVDSVASLGEAVTKKESLTYLDVSEHEFGNEGFAHLVENLEKSKLQTLCAYQCNLTELSEQTLQGLRQIKSLKELYLFGNDFNENDQQNYTTFFESLNIKVEF